MRLLRYRNGSDAALGVLVNDRVIPLSGLAADYPTMLSIVAGGSRALEAISAVELRGANSVPLSEVRLVAPLERPGKFLAIGMNYRQHVEEAKRLGIAAPANQFWFNKQTSCICGPYDTVDPGVSEALDYEAELCAVIGRPAKHVTAAAAQQHVFGYMVANDLSARDWQKHSPTFTVAKSFDSYGPIGPWIVTADEVPNPHALAIRCLVNGEVRQDSSTADMVYDLWQQIAYLSSAMTLEPGDLIATGTPSGVGVGMSPPRFLRAGDVIRCEIEGIGAIENRVVTPGTEQRR